MRLTALLPIALAVAAPAHAQHVGGVSGIHFNLGTPMSAPVNSYGGYGVTDFSRPFWQSSDIGTVQGLIATGHYAEADVLLSKIVGRTSSKQVRFLKGVTRLGMGDAEGARRYFEKSLYQGRNGYPGAMSGLAIAEIRLGNRDAAENILQKLRYQKEICSNSCDRAQPLDQAVAVVEKALT
ncbi:tetratricopeptide repeat protein [Sphingobium sp.]|uniref:tetratricopeptide repeat protein n=1 Tax=Sphingobium sp. TaxID=1912891 RepID=UPI002B873565|nr:tetratricopeptide repeat protein [Sphingobium sp.]HUD94016.1 tetratricopeptide repeat protein [Sphingobium sp.]